jgi:hypothetical protein
MSVEDDFHEAMLELYRRAKKELNYNALPAQHGRQ